jgi:hypothetical protein
VAFGSLPFTVALALVAAAAAWGAYELGHLALGAGAGVVTVYALHLLSLRRVRGRCRSQRILDRLSAELEGTVVSETIVVRRFTLAAVALIEGVMEVEEVVRTLAAAGRRPGEGFGARALEEGYLSAGEVKSLTETRRDARFLTDQVQLARQKLLQFRRRSPGSAG